MAPKYCKKGPYKRGRFPDFPPAWKCLLNCESKSAKEAGGPCGRLIPPLNCYGSIALTFQCGGICPANPGCDNTTPPTPFSEKISVDEMKAEVVKYSVPNPLSQQNLPIFNRKKIRNKNITFAFQDAACSIPCVDIKITVQAAGPLCIEVPPDGCTMYAAGDGLIKIQFSQATLQTFLDTTGLAPQVRINGKKTPFKAKDGQKLNITLETQSCASCDLISVKGKGIDIGNSICPATPLWIKKGKKLYLNKSKLVERLNRIKAYKILKRKENL